MASPRATAPPDGSAAIHTIAPPRSGSDRAHGSKGVWREEGGDHDGHEDRRGDHPQHGRQEPQHHREAAMTNTRHPSAARFSSHSGTILTGSVPPSAAVPRRCGLFRHRHRALATTCGRPAISPGHLQAVLYAAEAHPEEPARPPRNAFDATAARRPPAAALAPASAAGLRELVARDDHAASSWVASPSA